MEAIKTKEIRQPVVEHLLKQGMTIDERHDMRSVLDNPYVIITSDDVMVPTPSREEFRLSIAKEVNESYLLKYTKKEKVLSREEKIAQKLVRHLNSNGVKNRSGYEVIFTYQQEANCGLSAEVNILPISPNACGSISSVTMQIIIDWFRNNEPHKHYSFTYTDYDNNKARYGTLRPCISF